MSGNGAGGTGKQPEDSVSPALVGPDVSGRSSNTQSVQTSVDLQRPSTNQSVQTSLDPQKRRRLRPIPGAWWWLPLGLLLALLLLANWVTPTWREVRELKLDDWQVTRCVPSAGVEWKPATPPLSLTGDCWLLRTTFDRPELGLEGGMLMLAGAHQDAGVTINGVQVRNADVGGYNSFISGVLWLPLATGLLRTGDNELLLELRARSASGTLPNVYLSSAHVGPRRLMESFQMRHQWLHAFGAQSTLILLGAMLLFLLPIAVVRPRESLYRWFALALIGSAIYVSNFATIWRPLSLLAWGALIHLSLVLATYALVRCSAALRAETAPRWAAWLAGLAALGVLLEGLWWPRPGLALISVSLRLLILAQVLALTLWWWRRRAGLQVPNGRWFAAAMALLAVLGVLDTLRLMLREVWSTPGYLLHWGHPVRRAAAVRGVAAAHPAGTASGRAGPRRTGDRAGRARARTGSRIPAPSGRRIGAHAGR